MRPNSGKMKRRSLSLCDVMPGRPQGGRPPPRSLVSALTLAPLLLMDDGVPAGQAPGERQPYPLRPISASLSPPCSKCHELWARNKSLSGPQES